MITSLPNGGRDIVINQGSTDFLPPARSLPINEYFLFKYEGIS